MGNKFEKFAVRRNDERRCESNISVATDVAVAMDGRR